MNILQEVDLLIRSRYPVLVVSSVEDDRVINTIQNALSGRALYSWRLGESFESLIQDDNFRDLDAKDPLLALDKIDKASSEVNALFILRDFHLFWKNSAVLVKLRALSSRLKRTTKNIILLTPTTDIPLEIKNDITFLDFPLPNYSDMRSIYLDTASTLPNCVELPDDLEDQIIKSALGLTQMQAERVFFKCVTQHGTINEQSIDNIMNEKKQIIGSNVALRYYPQTETMCSVGGFNILKDWLKKRQKSFTDEAKSYGIPTPKGLLLVGIPGTGKSLVAKAVASLWRMPLIRLDVGAIFGGLVGQSEQNARKAIQIAETISPCILWVDEIEKGLFGQQKYHGDSGATSRVASTFLTWMQEKTKPVFIVATANDISGFAMEEMRMGRFDSIFFLDLPTENERKEIFRLHLEKRRPIIRKYDLNKLSKAAVGFTGAEIEQVIIESMHDAFFEDGRDFSQEDIEQTIKRTIPSSKAMTDATATLREWVSSNRIKSASGEVNPVVQGSGASIIMPFGVN